MLNLLPAILLLCSGSVLAAALGRRAEEAMPLTAGGLIVLLYLFYAADRLAWGYWTAVVLCCGCYAGALFLIVRRGGGHRSGFLARLCTPAMAAFAFVSVCSYLLVRDYVVSLWDELRLWGAYPKILYYEGTLQLGENAALFPQMQSYFPGMALYQYALLRVFGRFSERILFWAQAMLAYSFLLPALRGLRWKRAYLLPLAIFALLLIPQLFSNAGNDRLYFYQTLYIDPVLGILFAANLYYAYTGVCGTGFDTARLALGLAALTLMKDSGLPLALGACALAALIEYTERPLQHDAERLLSRRLRILICAAAPLAVFGLWKILISTKGIFNSLTLSGSGEAFSLDFVGTFLLALLRTPILRTNLELPFLEQMSYAGSSVLCFALIGLAILLLEPMQRRRGWIATGVLLAMNLVFAAGLLLLYVNSFSGRMPSYERYICTSAQTNITFAALLLFDLLQHTPSRRLFGRGPCKVLAGILAAAVLAVFPLRLGTSDWNMAFRPEEEKAEARAHAEVIRAAVPVREDENERIYLAFAEPVDVQHHFLYFELRDTPLRVANFVGEACFSEEADLQPGALYDLLRDKDVSYIYFAQDIPAAATRYPMLFPKGTQQGALYRIEETADGTALFGRLL